jgi:hypothetical protein
VLVRQDDLTLSLAEVDLLAYAHSTMIRSPNLIMRRSRMAKRDVTTPFKALLRQFVGEEDPLLSMLQWTTQQLMQVEAENKVGAEKGKHASDRRTYFSGYRWRRFDTRLGTTYLCVPKLRNGG